MLKICLSNHSLEKFNVEYYCYLNCNIQISQNKYIIYIQTIRA